MKDDGFVAASRLAARRCNDDDDGDSRVPSCSDSSSGASSDGNGGVGEGGVGGGNGGVGRLEGRYATAADAASRGRTRRAFVIDDDDDDDTESRSSSSFDDDGPSSSGGGGDNDGIEDKSSTTRGRMRMTSLRHRRRIVDESSSSDEEGGGEFKGNRRRRRSSGGSSSDEDVTEKTSDEGGDEGNQKGLNGRGKSPDDDEDDDDANKMPSADDQLASALGSLDLDGSDGKDKVALRVIQDYDLSRGILVSSSTSSTASEETTDDDDDYHEHDAFVPKRGGGRAAIVTTVRRDNYASTRTGDAVVDLVDTSSDDDDDDDGNSRDGSNSSSTFDDVVSDRFDSFDDSDDDNEEEGDEEEKDAAGPLLDRLHGLTLSPGEESPRGRSTEEGVASMTKEEEKKEEGDDDDDSAALSGAWSYHSASDEYRLPVGGENDNNGSGVNARKRGAAFADLRLPRPLYRKLYPHQRTGVEWMASLHAGGIGGILGDDMGMGKTYQTCSFVGGMMRAGTIRNVLIVCPVSVLRTWEREARVILERSCVPRVTVSVLSSDVRKDRRREILEEARRCPVHYPNFLITTYGLITSDPLDFVSRDDHGGSRGRGGRGHHIDADCHDRWDYVVCDEGHRLKNPSTKLSRGVQRVCRDPRTRRLLLTGTPIQNNLKELWALFDFAASGRLLGKLRTFLNRYGDPIENGRLKNATEWTIKTAAKAERELQEVLRPHFLQRTKDSEFRDKLPDKRELVVFTHLSERQRTMYESYVHHGGAVQSVLAGEVSSPLEAISWLKKLCGHPQLVSWGEERRHADFASSLADVSPKALVRESAKLRVLVDLIERLRRSGHRTLIFSQSTKMLDIVQVVLEHRGTILSRIDGAVKERDRQRAVDEFNRERSHVDAMLLSTKAGGLGLTLTGADRAIIYDPSWNPADDSQAVDRCFRIGQTKNVTVYRFISAGTVEEGMYKKVVFKDGIKRAVMSTGGSATERYFNRDELRKLFQLAPAGSCEMLSTIRRGKSCPGSTVGASGKPSFLESHKGVVGLASHDNLYNNSVVDLVDESDPPTPFGGTPMQRGVKAQGRARCIVGITTKLDFSEASESRYSSIVAGQGKEQNQRSPMENITNNKGPAVPPGRKLGGKNTTANVTPGDPKQDTIIPSTPDVEKEHILLQDEMAALLDILEEGQLSGNQKLTLHKDISALAVRLGWL